MRVHELWNTLLLAGYQRATRVLHRLEALTRYRIYTQTRVLICTVDSTERMLRSMEEGTSAAATAAGVSSVCAPEQILLDIVIMDEAACVLETAVPVILNLGASNLTLVGDQHQLQPFSLVQDDDGATNHTRSLMERALKAGASSQFLSTQYRMHPRISAVSRQTCIMCQTFFGCHV